VEYLLHEQDVNMGNEDSWTLVIPDDKSDVYVNHRWSHRVGSYNFKSGEEKLSLEGLRKSKQWLYKKAVEYLESIEHTA
jgi:hypothetical protein